MLESVQVKYFLIKNIFYKVSMQLTIKIAQPCHINCPCQTAQSTITDLILSMVNEDIYWH